MSLENLAPTEDGQHLEDSRSLNGEHLTASTNRSQPCPINPSYLDRSFLISSSTHDDLQKHVKMADETYNRTAPHLQLQRVMEIWLQRQVDSTKEAAFGSSWISYLDRVRLQIQAPDIADPRFNRISDSNSLC